MSDVEPTLPDWRNWATVVSVCLLGGLLSALIWHRLVEPPVYLMDANQGATIGESGLAQLFTSDAVFSTIGICFGTMFGILTQVLLKKVGWPVGLFAAVGALAAAVICWRLGLSLGPQNFATRVSTAGPGELVSEDFALNSMAALVIWPLFAVLPILVTSLVQRSKRSELTDQS